jgi:hypothetical protein
MRIISASSKNFTDELAAFCRTAASSKEMTDSVAAILADVRERGDAAITYYAAKFDGAKLAPRNFVVKPEELAAAAKRLAPADKKAILAAHESVLSFNKKGLPKDWTGKNPHGAQVGEMHHPLRRVGINVPRGQVPLASTAIMTITLAKIAGVPEIAVFTPCDANGRVADVLMGTFHLCGATEVYRVGGVYGVGAMAYGTTSIPAVDKIAGPSNAYVCEAMRQVFGTVGVAGLPGPSEVLILADDTARPDFAAADLLAQAEHGSGKEKIYLVGTSADVIARDPPRSAVAVEDAQAFGTVETRPAARLFVDRGRLAQAGRRGCQLRGTGASGAARQGVVCERSAARHHDCRRHHGRQLYADVAGRLHRRPQPCAAHGPRGAFLQRPARRRLYATHQRDSLRQDERQKGGAGRFRVCPDGTA